LRDDLFRTTLPGMPDALFPDLAARPAERPAPDADRPVRLQTANREQIELTPTDLEALLPPGHAARLVWRFVDGLDLRAFYAPIAARDGHAGRPAIDPKILLALWLYAISDGVGSAREVDRLCYAHDAYRWLRGGVSVNYHTLSDFRVQHGAALNTLLTQSMAALLHRRVITLRRVAQDGMRVRASAGASSFRRRESLQECLRQARKQVERTARQVDGDRPSREAAAEARAAREREARVAEALAVLPEVEAVKARGRSTSAPRVSTTDPDARVMKMGDGGFRPAYNVEFATDVDGRAIVGVSVTNVGSDAGQLVPMLDQVEARTGQRPDAYLADSGFAQGVALDTSATRGITLYSPPPKAKSDRAPGEPCRGDSPAEAQWRTRMATPEAKAIYKDRAATAEWTNAQTRGHRALNQFVVRGLGKVTCWALWVALAHNMLRTMGIVPHLMS
jgi:transposase